MRDLLNNFTCRERQLVIHGRRRPPCTSGLGELGVLNFLLRRMFVSCVFGCVVAAGQMHAIASVSDVRESCSGCDLTILLPPRRCRRGRVWCRLAPPLGFFRALSTACCTDTCWCRWMKTPIEEGTVGGRLGCLCTKSARACCVRVSAAAGRPGCVGCSAGMPLPWARPRSRSPRRRRHGRVSTWACTYVLASMRT